MRDTAHDLWTWRISIMQDILNKLVAGTNLTKEEAMEAQELILTGQATPAQIA